MPDLLVRVDGTAVPLSDCVWVMFRPCGCPCGVLTAAYGDIAHATEAQAWHEFFPTKREREKYQRQGLRLELMVFDRYRREIDLAAKCPHGKSATTQQTLDAAAGGQAGGDPS
ncbi:hypothetical protein [Streptomyces synnematoformans]|uniref:Uncharacterized protein n=1 Tax=Streptomyces synnematoformans TaxID=415721 RepID=A0ABN2XAV5_9ACTN